MEWLKILRLLFCHKEEVPLPSPVSRKIITSQRLEKIIRVKFPTGDIELSDNEFDLCDIEDIETFLDVDETNHYKFVKRLYDCDNFARRLWGQFSTPEWGHFAIGLLWSDKHAMIACVDTNEDFWLIEPQNDKRRSDLVDWQGTAMRFIIF